jgi:transposase
MEKFLEVYDRWEQRELTQAEAAEILGRSERQFRRYIDLYESEGLDGLRDGRLGKRSPKALPTEVEEAILALYRNAYRGWNMKHFHEHIVKHYNYSLSYSCLRGRLQGTGLVRVEKRKGGHRKKRERKPCVGMMLHQDGSREVWLEGQPALDLIVTMDDATSEIYSAFLVEEEGTMSTFRGLLEVLLAHGVPSTFYTDRGSHYFFTPEVGGKVDKVHVTQVGRALAQLGVEHIAAYSPEARGRSERMFGTLQDRLIKELRLAGIDDVGAANEWIKTSYLPDHNQRFMVEAALPDRAFVTVETSRLVEALCIEEERTVGRDNTIAWNNKRLQLPESPLRRHYVQAKVKVHAYPDGTLAVLHGPRVIGRYTGEGVLVADDGQAAGAGSNGKVAAVTSVAPRSVPSRHGLAASPPAEASAPRPTLTGPRRGAKDLPCRKTKRCAA